MDHLERLRDFAWYVEQYWWLHDKIGRVVRFVPNAAQKRVLLAGESQRRRGRGVRLKVLKGRQMGISTLASAMMEHSCLTHTGRTALSIADKLDLPAQWLRRGRQWYDQLPDGFRPNVKATNAIELYFDSLHSRYYIASQAGQTPGMGFAVQCLHASELANWGDPPAVLDDLMPGIPQSPETIVVFESTGEIAGDWWYQSIQASLRGEDEYEVVFLPWYIMADYRRDDLAADVTDLSRREREIVKLAAADGYEIDHAQLAWRRVGVSGEPWHGDEVAFDSKFPTSIEDAFLSPGRVVFAGDMVDAAAQTVREPAYKADLLHRTATNPYDWHLARREHGDLWVYDEPDDRYHYVIGSDQMWGKVTVSRVAGRERELDYDAAYVECLETRRICAVMRGRYDLKAWGMHLAALGKWYNWATLAPERNGTESAEVLLPILLGNVADWRYPNIWVRTDDVKLTAHRIQDYGWYTDTGSKGDLVAFAKMATIDGSMDWADERAVAEMRAWIHDDKGRMTTPMGMHDDCLMARMITAYVSHRMRPSVDLWQEPVVSTFRFTPLSERVRRMVGDEEE